MTTVKRKSKQLGQILIELGMITPEQLEQALEEHRRTPKSIGRVLIDHGHDQGGRPGPRARRAGWARVRRSVRVPGRPHGDHPAARGARSPVSRDPHRRARRQAAGGDVRPRQRLRPRRHPHDHRTATCSRWSPRPPTSSRRSRSSPAWTARSRRSRASPPTRSRAKRSRWRRPSRTPRSSSWSTRS